MPNKPTIQFLDLAIHAQRSGTEVTGRPRGHVANKARWGTIAAPPSFTCPESSKRETQQ